MDFLERLGIDVRVRNDEEGVFTRVYVLMEISERMCVMEVVGLE